MNTTTTAVALVGILSAAVIYGTDLFCALVVRPAAGGAADASVADLIGRIHEYGDRRLPVPGVVSIIAAGLAVPISNGAPARIGAAIALVALLAWLAIYLRISAPINKKLRTAAANHTVPADTKELQRSWDRVIWLRAVLQVIALAGLLAVIVVG
jgi:anthrone oxygenase-like protein